MLNLMLTLTFGGKFWKFIVFSRNGHYVLYFRSWTFVVTPVTYSYIKMTYLMKISFIWSLLNVPILFVIMFVVILQFAFVRNPEEWKSHFPSSRGYLCIYLSCNKNNHKKKMILSSTDKNLISEKKNCRGVCLGM